MFRHAGHPGRQLCMPLIGSAPGADSTDNVWQWSAVNQATFSGSLGCQELWPVCRDVRRVQGTLETVGKWQKNGEYYHSLLMSHPFSGVWKIRLISLLAWAVLLIPSTVSQVFECNIFTLKLSLRFSKKLISLTLWLRFIKIIWALVLHWTNQLHGTKHSINSS